jgi:hypothetical protein
MISGKGQLMARDVLRVWLKLDRIHCHDEGDGWGSAEPYLWTVFFKIDGDTVALTESLTLSGTPTVVATPGSHGNLGDTDVDAGDDLSIPSAIGDWSPFLTPIPVPASLKPLVGDDLPGVAGVVCVLMEEDNVTDDGAEAGHAALNTAVASALADIIATRSFSNPDITEEEIDQYMEAVRDAVSDAVKSQQSFFENLWSWLNEDDTVGTRVFFWKHGDLADGDPIDFAQRWEDEGDWELFGHINATVVCTAEAAAAASDILDAMFSRVSRNMRSFRDREVGGTNLQLWWSLAERNSPQLGYSLRRDPQLVEAAAALMGAVPELLENREAPLSRDHVGHARRILQRLREVGNRQTRIDASRALDVLGHLQGRTVREAIELLSSVQPGRTPRPVKDISRLLNPGLRVPKSVFQPIEPP